MNPTPGNLILADGDAQWWITSQGGAMGPDAVGADDRAPPIDRRQYVQVQSNGYGYGCACLTVETDRATRRITRVLAGQTRPLAQCRRDARLPRP